MLSRKTLVWGKAKEPIYSTTILSQKLLVQKYPMSQLIDERPYYNGQIYSWTEVLGQDYLGRYCYRVYTGRYNIDYAPDYTYESLYVSNLSDEELKLISQADTLHIVFISADEKREAEKCKHLDNRSFAKQLVFAYYQKEKERYLEKQKAGLKAKS
ncbi:UNVERIFIED_CONTAM: hypothetical protein PYX00_010983 [Menopon gallinae]|uniref:Uncharacterized protein n=1 Tax=Menopon gallinae TaxID=328185 RepID=A0AAW2H720_9NEOP